MGKIEDIYKILLENFGYQGWWPLLNYKTNKIEYHLKDFSYPKTEEEKFEICIGAILTQNTSWLNVEKAIKNLKQNNALDVNSIERLKEKELALLIKSSGYHNQKSKKLKAFVKFYNNKNKKITRESLLNIWGIGPETADSILLYAYKKPFFVIDAYTKRIFSRIGLCNKNISYSELQELIQKSIKKDYRIYNEYHALLVKLGKDICKTKPLCRMCPLNKMCNKIMNY